MGSFTTIIAILAIGTLSTISAQNELTATEQPSENASTLITEDTYEEFMDRVYKTRCDETGGSDAFEVVRNASLVFRGCQGDILNSTGGRTGVKDEKDYRGMGEFFKKFCNRLSDAGKCFTDYDASVRPCMTDEERSNQMIAQNMTKTLFTTLCENEASLMISFVEAGGLECIKNNADLDKCSYTWRASPPMIEELVSMTPWPRMNSTQDCKSFYDAQTCIITALGRCADPTPSTVAVTVFNKLNPVTPCGIQPTEEVPNNDDD